jgi:peptidyl-prolyl cis-trans isomerase SurA
MKIIKIFFLLLLLSINNNVHANLNNKIIVKVENKIITNFELKNKIISTLLISNNEINQQSIDSLKKQSLETLINSKIKLIELSKYNLKEDNSQLNNYLKLISNNDVDGLKKKFKEYNLDFELFLDEIKIELKWKKLIFNTYKKKIVIDHNLIDKEINEILKKRTTIEEFNLSEIEILKSENTPEKKLIENLLNMISKLGFEETANKNSIALSAPENGSLGWLKSTTLNKEIYKNIKELKKGELSKPIFQQDSIIILKLNDKRFVDKEKINLENLKKELISKKKNNIYNLYSSSRLSKLKNSSLIEYVK